MEPIDLLALNKASNSYSVRNAFLGRQTLLPRCAKRWRIVGGPTHPRIWAAPADVLPWEMSKRHGFKHADQRISDRVPVEFSIDSETSRKYECGFSVEVVIWSVDTYPDPHSLEWSMFGCSPSKHTVDELSECLALRGAFRSISDSGHTPEGLKGADYKECIIVYNSKRSRGWLGEIADAEELPTCGVIKDFYVLAEVISKFAGGFMETNTPDGLCHWGRLNGGSTGSWISCDALKVKSGKWRYAPSNKDGWSLNLIGVRYVNKENVHWYELLGDALLCSDGTVLHSYYFSRKEKEWGDSPSIPSDWKDGYYHNRLYPPESPTIPKRITDSFEHEMPAWFYKDDEARKAKREHSTR